MAEVLSVIIPVYNEAVHLREWLDFYFKTPCPLKREVIFVDDRSTDDSYKILCELQKDHGFTLLQNSVNKGKGGSVALGIQKATGDLLIIQDADFEYDPYDVPALLEPLIQKRADVVFGSRFKKNALQVHRTYHYFVNRTLTMLSNVCSGIYVTDMETCYKVFKTDLVQSMNLSSQRFGVEVEFTAYIAKTSARVFELPISYYPRTYLQGKKIGWRDGLAALWHIFEFNFLTPFEKAFTNLPEHYAPGRSRHRDRH